MREDIQISAVIPTYNREKTIARAIDSVLSQEYPASEIEWAYISQGGSKGTTTRNGFFQASFLFYQINTKLGGINLEG